MEIYILFVNQYCFQTAIEKNKKESITLFRKYIIGYGHLSKKKRNNNNKLYTSLTKLWAMWISNHLLSPEEEGREVWQSKKHLKNNKQKIVATSCAQLSQSFVMTTNQIGLQEKRK